METGRVIHGDCLEVMKEMEDNSVDSVITDPPYGLSKTPDIFEVMKHWMNGDDYEHKGKGFMGRDWDSFVPGPNVWKECFRLLKPGGYLLAFSSCRTWDLLSIAIRFAGFENRDTMGHANSAPCLAWVQGQGFPKSTNISKQIDQANGKSGKVVGKYKLPNGKDWNLAQAENPDGTQVSGAFTASGVRTFDIIEPESEEAKQWIGYGTGMKPSWEVILMFRKPFKGPVYKNVLEFGTGALNIDATRLGYVSEEDKNVGGRNKPTNSKKGMYGRMSYLDSKTKAEHSPADDKGRWPANVLMSHDERCEYLGQKKVSPGNGSGKVSRGNASVSMFGIGDNQNIDGYVDNEGNETIEDWKCHPECSVRMLDEQSDIRKAGGSHKRRICDAGYRGGWKWVEDAVQNVSPSEGGASRFFYCSKASRKERDVGLENFELKKHKVYAEDKWTRENMGDTPAEQRELARNDHPTVKPINVLRWILKLVTPPNGLTLDPFAGTGTSGIAAELEGFKYIGIELDEHYCKIAEARVKYWTENKDEILRKLDKKGKGVVKDKANGIGKQREIARQPLILGNDFLSNFMVEEDNV